MPPSLPNLSGYPQRAELQCASTIRPLGPPPLASATRSSAAPSSDPPTNSLHVRRSHSDIIHDLNSSNSTIRSRPILPEPIASFSRANLLTPPVLSNTMPPKHADACMDEDATNSPVVDDPSLFELAEEEVEVVRCECQLRSLDAAGEGEVGSSECLLKW